MLIEELFAGIGGLGLGLERAIPGARIAWQVEQNPFCRQILKRHWPDAQQFEDVRWFPGHPPEQREKFADKKPWIQERKKYEVDIIAAGFPCQGASVAGKRLGLSDDRTALWWEVVRIARVLRPRYLVLENVSGLLTVSGGQDFGTVLGSLAKIGYDAEWTCISAAEFGAPHKRERLFIIGTTANAYNVCKHAMSRYAEMESCKKPTGFEHWKKTESPMVGMADGLSRPMDRYRALGNAVVPQCAEWIGQRIASYQAEQDIPW